MIVAVSEWSKLFATDIGFVTGSNCLPGVKSRNKSLPKVKKASRLLSILDFIGEFRYILRE